MQDTPCLAAYKEAAGLGVQLGTRLGGWLQPRAHLLCCRADDLLVLLDDARMLRILKGGLHSPGSQAVGRLVGPGLVQVPLDGLGAGHGICIPLAHVPLVGVLRPAQPRHTSAFKVSASHDRAPLVDARSGQ